MSTDESVPSALAHEFDTVASWTEDAVVELGRQSAIAATSRGSGQPAALDWLIANLGLKAGRALLDVGAGLGGPSAYAARAHGLVPVLIEPMMGAAAAARRLFALPVVVADARALPVASESFDAAWCLGVLCTTEFKAQVVAELHRVLRPSGRVGLLMFERTVDVLPYQPDGNYFSSSSETDTILAGAGFVIIAQTALVELAPAPDAWSATAEQVGARIAHRHAADPRFQQASAQSELIHGLLRDGLVRGRLIAAREERW